MAQQKRKQQQQAAEPSPSPHKSMPMQPGAVQPIERKKRSREGAEARKQAANAEEQTANQQSEDRDMQPQHPEHVSDDDQDLQGVNLDSENLLSEDLDTAGTTEDLETGSGEGDEDRPPKKRKKVLQEERLKRLKEEYDKRGVVYVSRIPPHMKPMKLKQLLSQYGEILRVYCAPEDARVRKMRKQKGGNTGKNFTEGWVEFADKRIAKRVANAINGQRIGGKRRSAYYDDLWVVKYLKHFKWDHLTEEIAYQRAVREQRLATEISAAKKERDHYLAQVDKAKALAAMEERHAAKQSKPEAAGHEAGGSGGAGAPGPRDQEEAGQKAPRFKNRDIGQRAPRADPGQGAATDRELADDVLMMVARRKKAAA